MLEQICHLRMIRLQRPVLKSLLFTCSNTVMCLYLILHTFLVYKLVFCSLFGI
jgi:hypothetical protein